MAITVRRLAEHKDLGLKLVAGRENADRVINWAHAIELADPTPYLSGGELVMTTGLKMGPTNDEQYEYVARLSAVGVVALAFDTGTNFERVPDGVLSAGDALGLPILQVPADTPFIAITRAVIDELTADQLRTVQRVVDQQEIFVRATLRDGVPGAVAALSQALSATAVVIGTDGRPLAATGRDTEHVIAITAEAARNMRPHIGRRHASRVMADGAGYLTIQTVRAAQTARGYLAVRSRIDDEIVLVVPAERAGKPRDIHRRLGAQLERQLGGGQSSPTSLGDLDFGLNQARVAALAHADSRFSEFDHLAVLPALLGNRDPTRRCSTRLKPFLSCNGEVETAATKLNVHRHTIGCGESVNSPPAIFSGPTPVPRWGWRSKPVNCSLSRREI